MLMVKWPISRNLGKFCYLGETIKGGGRGREGEVDNFLIRIKSQGSQTSFQRGGGKVKKKGHI